MLKRMTFIALAIFGVASCTKQELSVETKVPEKLTASMEEFTSKTKVQINEEMKTVWTEGDQLTVFYKNEQNDCWQFDGKTGDRNGTFSRISDEELEDPTLSDIFLVYPYSENTIFEAQKKRITINVPSVQTYTEGSYSPGSNIMFAKTQSDKFTMKNLCGYIMFQIKGDQTIKSIKLTGKQQEKVSGLSYVNTEKELLDYDPDMHNTDDFETRAGGDTSKELVLDCGKGVELDREKAITFYLALVPRVFQEGFEIEIECENGFAMKKSTKGSFSVKRNTVYKMKEFDVIPNAEDIPLEADAVAFDFSESGTANSYIVTEDGYYKFPTVKGNSNEPVGKVAKAEVLWESFGTDVAPYERDLIAALNFSKDTITFQATENKGNALIAAKDEEGKILWSWHIWMTEQPKDQLYLNGAGTMMDRNLGATSANLEDGTKTYGLLYQWGRKDPFFKNSGDDMIASTLGKWDEAETSEAIGTVEYATANPTCFIRDEHEYNWHYHSDYTLWGSTKTIYDPCPAGYRVPDGGTSGIWGRALLADHSYIINGVSQNNAYVFESSCQTPFSTEAVSYPASGYLDHKALPGETSGALWSCLQENPADLNNVMDNPPYGLMIMPNDDETYDTEVLPFSRKLSAVNALSVRCYKENSAVPVNAVDLTAGDDEPANSYIVTKDGYYKFPTVKGNSGESVGKVAKVEVLWETFGTDEDVKQGDLVPYLYLDGDSIIFKASDKKGNALIAAEDSEGNVLWSWHIWMTDQPKDQVYRNTDGEITGTMMDRNLGATSTVNMTIEALGLLYQWGRKDPFLSKGNNLTNDIALSTSNAWNEKVSNQTTGTIEYATKHPQTFIDYGIIVNDAHNNCDWYYTGAYEVDTTRWKEQIKTKYDPCPSGYRVPASFSPIWDPCKVSDDTEISFNSGSGYNFGTNSMTSIKLTDETFCWYPIAGYLKGIPEKSYINDYGYYHTCKSYKTINDFYYQVEALELDNSQKRMGIAYIYRSIAASIRCQKSSGGN